MVSSLDLPEVYGLTGTILFVILSLFTSIFNKYCPKRSPYLYQTAALAGFGQLVYNFTNTQMQTRVFLNLTYIVFSLANVGGLFAWLLYKRRNAPGILKYAYLFLIMLPANLFVSSLYFGYLQPFPLPFFVLPSEIFPVLFIILALGLLAGALTTYSPRAIAIVAVLKAKLNNKIAKR